MILNKFRHDKRAEITGGIGLFIILVIFLSLSAYLIGTIPESLATGPDNDLDYMTAPDTFDFLDLTEYGASVNFTLYDGFAESWGKETFGHDMRLIGSSTYGIYNTHFFGFLNWYFHQMEWYNASGINRGEFLSFAELELDQDSQNISYYQVRCEHFTMEAYFGYNTTAYTDFEDAFDNSDLQVLFTIGFDEMGTTWNAWSIVGNLLTFRQIDIGPPFFTYLFGIIFYGAIAGLMILILTSLLPFG